MMFVDQRHAQHLGKMAALQNLPESSCPFELGSWMEMHWLRAYRFERKDSAPVPEVIAPQIPEPELIVANPEIPLSFLAKQKLQETDYIEFRAATSERRPSSNWLTWREQLREVVRGNLDAIPPEPARYITPA